MVVDASSATTYPFASSGIWGDLQGAVEIKGLVKRLCRAPPGRKGYRKGWLRTEKVAGSSPAERAPIYPANRSNSKRPEPSIRIPRPARFNCTANRRRTAPEPILAPSPRRFLCRSRQPPRPCSSARPRLASSLSRSGRHLLIDDDGVAAVAE